MTSGATPAGTAAYRAALASEVPDAHFRTLDGLVVSSIGLGTYLGEEDDESDRGYGDAWGMEYRRKTRGWEVRRSRFTSLPSETGPSYRDRQHPTGKERRSPSSDSWQLSALLLPSISAQKRRFDVHRKLCKPGLPLARVPVATVR